MAKYTDKVFDWFMYSLMTMFVSLVFIGLIGIGFQLFQYVKSSTITCESVEK